MNYTKLMKNMLRATLILAALVLTAGPSFAADITVNLAAVEAQWLPPGGTTGDEIKMWGFIEANSCPTLPVTWDVGVEISALAGDNLTINLLNCLSEPVSIVIPGQAAIGTPVWDGDRVRSFTNEVSASSTASYTWTGVKAGTYLYQSGTHPAKQVQMGLYGALKVDFAAGTPNQAYDGIPYDSEVLLLYSEIDPALHDPPAVPTPLDYIPAYYLINGKPYEDGDLETAGNVSQNTLIRFINAGLKTHVPTLLNAPYMRVIAEDGNLYPYAKTQYSVLLAAGKTMDAIWSPTAQGTYPLVDRANYLTTAGVTDGGNYAYLDVGTATDAPVAVNDNYTVAEGGLLTADGTAPNPNGVLFNDTGVNTLEAVLVGNVSNGTLALSTDGTFSYTHNGGQTTTDSFTYKAKEGDLESNVATVSITVTPVNDAPVAVNDTYEAAEGIPLNVTAPGVLGNDSDVDGDPLTATLDTNVSGGELITLNSDGSFSYTANSGTTSDSFTYHANDGLADSNVATVTITVSAPDNTAPVAADDFATTPKNTTVFIDLVVNDTDAENNLKDALGDVAASQISIVTNPTRGGTVTVLTNGVNYTPKKNFRGTDVFTYTVSDIAEEPSNTATVRVNVTNN